MAPSALRGSALRDRSVSYQIDQNHKRLGFLAMHMVVSPVRGATRPVSLDCEFGGVGHDPYGQDTFGFHGSYEIEREEWGLLWNVALEAGGILVAKKVRIEIAGKVIRQS